MFLSGCTQVDSVKYWNDVFDKTVNGGIWNVFQSGFCEDMTLTQFQIGKFWTKIVIGKNAINDELNQVTNIDISDIIHAGHMYAQSHVGVAFERAKTVNAEVSL